MALKDDAGFDADLSHIFADWSEDVGFRGHPVTAGTSTITVPGIVEGLDRRLPYDMTGEENEVVGQIILRDQAVTSAGSKASIGSVCVVRGEEFRVVGIRVSPDERHTTLDVAKA